MDDTSQRIVDAAMELIRDKGYVATTTKDIAKQAGVNECTLFRKFAGKRTSCWPALTRKSGGRT